MSLMMTMVNIHRLCYTLLMLLALLQVCTCSVLSSSSLWSTRRAMIKAISSDMRDMMTSYSDHTQTSDVITDVHREWFESLSSTRVAPRSGALLVRKELRTLTQSEWDSVVSAVWEAMSTYPDANSTYSEYDLFVQNHLLANAPAAHLGAAFLPWHREFLFRYETMLQSHGLQTGLPYWDPTLDTYLSDPYGSMMWSDVFMGPGRNVVDSGPFAFFPVMEECIAREEFGFVGSETLERQFAPALFSRDVLYNDEDVEFFFSRTHYAELCRTRHEEFEATHDAGHGTISGQMIDVQCSPSDPVFFIYHNYMDYLWEVFRMHHQQTDPQVEYPSEDHGGKRHDADAPMLPFTPLVNIDGLRNTYTTDYYTFAPTPDACSIPDDCGSPYLTCDVTRGRCISKMRAGFPCQSFPDSCYGECVEGVCN